jgi:hypothetical protein
MAASTISIAIQISIPLSAAHPQSEKKGNEEESNTRRIE